MGAGAEEPKRGRGRPPGSGKKPEEPPPPVVSLVVLAGPTADLTRPMYMALGVPYGEVPTAEAWALFYTGWQAVIDYYFPEILRGSPIPVAIIGTFAVTAPLLPILMKQWEAKRVRAQRPRPSSDGSQTPSPPRVEGAPASDGPAAPRAA